MRIWGIDYRNTIVEARLATQMLVLVVMVVVGVGRSVGGLFGVIERVGEGAVGGRRLRVAGAAVCALMSMRCDSRRRRGWTLGRASREVDRISAYRDAIFAVVDAPAIGKDVDIGAFGPELAVALLGLAKLR